MNDDAAPAANDPLPAGEGVNGRLRPLNGTRVGTKHHPSRGGNPYPPEMRLQVIRRHQLNRPMTTPEITQLRDEKAYPSIATCKRWIRQFNQLGHSRPKRATGNNFAGRQVQGEQLVQLALFRLIKPKSTLDKS